MELIDDVLVHAYSRPISWTILRLLGITFSRALVRGLALCLLHSEALLIGVLHVLLSSVDPRHLLILCHPVSHGPQCTQPCKCFNVVISQTMNVAVLGRLCSPSSNSAVSLFVRGESWGHLMCLFRPTSRHHLLALNTKLSLSFIRLCIDSSKICGFKLLSFVGTRHVNFMLQAASTTLVAASQQVRHSIKEPHLWNLQCFVNCLVVCTWHHSTTNTSVIEGLGCTPLIQQCVINRTLVIDPTISPISSMT